jgi:predicted nucleotidyltransferase
MANLYTPEDIASFLLEEKLAIHGVSPEVYTQNQLLVQELGKAATDSSDALLAVQVIGSRSNGTSGLESDLDLVVVTFDTDTAHEDSARLAEVAEGLGISTDTGLAALANRAHDTIPAEGADFICWIDTKTHQASSLFEKGLYASPNQRLGQLAVTSMLASYVSESMAQDQWSVIRKSHAYTYLGDLGRMQEKLVERLGSEQEKDIMKVISKDLMRQRRTKYAMPKDMRAYHAKLENWAKRNKAQVQQLSGYELYQDVLSEL